MQTPKVLLAVIALSTSGCVWSLFSAKFPNDVKVQAVYMNEGLNKTPPPVTACVKTWLPRTVKLSLEKIKASENTYVTWVFVNECDEPKGAAPAAVRLTNWALGAPLKPKDKKRKPGTATAPPFDIDSCKALETGTLVPYHNVTTLTCKASKTAPPAKGEYHYAVILRIGDYEDNKDTVIYIED